MVPEGLLPTLTLALVLATQRMAKRHVLIRYLPSVETLGSTTVICTDKTGTLTQNRMTVRQIWLGAGVECAPNPGLEPADAALYRPFFMTARLCHDLREGEQQGRTARLGDPMEIALVETAERFLSALPACKKLDEIPFDVGRMRLSTVHETPEGPTLFCKGAPEMVLPLCDRILADGKTRSLDSDLRARVHETQEAMAAQGLAGHRDVLPAARGTVAARAGGGKSHLRGARRARRSAPSRGAGGAAQVPRSRHRGDHGHRRPSFHRPGDRARDRAHPFGRPAGNHGRKLRALTDTQLRLALDTPEIIFARVGADQKRRIVEALKRKGHVVAVTGDGVNDAPALKSAHIGIAMGITGTDVAKEAADMVLLDDNFASIVNAVEEGRAVFSNIRKFLTYILAHNVPELIPYLVFSLFSVPLALTPIQILSIDMGTDSLTALGLGVEKPDPRMMQRPPRSQHQRLFDWPLALRAYLFLGAIEAAIAMAAFFFVLHGGGWRYGQALAMSDPLYLRATTACFSAIVVTADRERVFVPQRDALDFFDRDSR